LVTSETAIVVSTKERDEKEVVQGLVSAVTELAGDEACRTAMGIAAIAHVTSNMSWNARVRGALELFDKINAGRSDIDSTSDFRQKAPSE
jgi:hypothetical protein